MSTKSPLVPVIIVFLVLVLSAGAIGCAKPDSPRNPSAQTPPAKTPDQPKSSGTGSAGGAPVNLTFAAGATGGDWYMIAQGIAEAVRKTNPNASVTVLPGGGVANIERVFKKEVDLAFSYPSDVKDALAGSEPFKQAMPEIRVIGATHATYSQMPILKKVGITSWDEIKQKKYPIRVSAYQRGAGPELYVKRLLEAHGITYQDIESWGGKVVFVGMTEASRLMKDGQVDAAEFGGAPPSAPLVDLVTTTDVSWLKWNPDAVKAVVQKYGYTDGFIPGGAYKFDTKECYTLTAPTIVIARADLPESTVELVAKALYTQRDYLGTVHSAVKLYQASKPDAMVAGLTPMHPGAEKYFKEIKLLK